MPNPESKADCLRPPALVISLDFELHWGVRDLRRLDALERARLMAARRVVPALLEIFEEFGIHATWATVGFLFARSKSEREEFSPGEKPSYQREELDAYRETVGKGEDEDPFHYGWSLIQEVGRHAGQEIASHSFSHYYCREAGQTLAQFDADLRSAVAIAAESGYAIQSYVFPRNQPQPAYLAALERAGISSYRACEPGWLNAPRDARAQRRWYRRLGRLADSYVNLSGAKTQAWPLAPKHSKPSLLALSASRYLSPYRRWLQPLEPLRYQRIVKAMEHAARRREIFHLWWHPEDFASNPGRNLKFLRSILVAFDRLRSRFGMQSFSMADVAAAAFAEPGVRQPAFIQTSIIQPPSMQTSSRQPALVQQSPMSSNG